MEIAVVVSSPMIEPKQVGSIWRSDGGSVLALTVKSGEPCHYNYNVLIFPIAGGSVSPSNPEQYPKLWDEGADTLELLHIRLRNNNFRLIQGSVTLSQDLFAQ